MDPIIIAAIIGAIASIVASIIGKITIQKRRHKTHNFQNAFQAGWGLYRLVNEWVNDPNVTPNFRGMIAQVQPYFKAMGFNMDLLASFESGQLPKDWLPFAFEIESELTARFGRKMANTFKLGQALFSTTRAVYKYATDLSYRHNLENGGFTLSGLTAALDEPLEELRLPKSIKKEWKDIVSLVANGSFNKNKLWPRIQDWIVCVRQTILQKSG